MRSKAVRQGEPLWRIILCVGGSILVFVVTAIISSLATAWIKDLTIAVPIRELLLRTPLTIWFLHLFAGKVIRTYDPGSLYRKMTFPGILKWVGIGTILPLSVYLFYYYSHETIPFARSISLNEEEKLSKLIKWISISIAAGITEEILFRGHLYNIIKKRYSNKVAIPGAALLFGGVHIFMLTKITPVDIVIVVFGGMLTGIMFSSIYRYSGVIWYCAIVHIIWDIFFIGQIISISSLQTQADKTILAFKLLSRNILLTGGNFGVEAALPCLLIYFGGAVVFRYLAVRKEAGRLLS